MSEQDETQVVEVDASEPESVEQVVEVEELEPTQTTSEPTEEPVNATTLELTPKEEDRERLMSYTIPDLKKIAEQVGISVSGKKADIVESLLEKKYGDQVAPAPEEGEAPEVGEVAEEAPQLPVLEDPSEILIKHLMVTIGMYSDPDRGIWDWNDCNKLLESWFARGFEVIEFDTVGFLPEGHRLLYVLRKVDKPAYKEAHHIVRTLTARPDPELGTISGFQADVYLSSYLDDGWTLVGARYNGNAHDGIYMAWMLVR